MTVSVKAPTSTTGSIQLNGSDVLTIDSSGNVTAPNKLISTGHVLQVVQSVKTDAFTTTSGSFVIPSGLSVNITPSSTANKILIMCYTNFAVSNDSGHSYGQLQRDGTALNIADAAATRPRAAVVQNNYGDNAPPNYSLCYLDSPSSTSSITYSFGIRSSNGTTVYLNRSVRDANSGTYDGRTSSAIIVMEVAG